MKNIHIDLHVIRQENVNTTIIFYVNVLRHIPLSKQVYIHNVCTELYVRFRVVSVHYCLPLVTTISYDLPEASHRVVHR